MPLEDRTLTVLRYMSLSITTTQNTIKAKYACFPELSNLILSLRILEKTRGSRLKTLENKRNTNVRSRADGRFAPNMG